MWEKWDSCPVIFPETEEDWDGHYDDEKDIIYINLNNVTVNHLAVYLWCLVYRQHHENYNKTWVTEQVVLLWNTMSRQEKVKLGKMLFDREVR